MGHIDPFARAIRHGAYAHRDICPPNGPSRLTAGVGSYGWHRRTYFSRRPGESPGQCRSTRSNSPAVSPRPSRRRESTSAPSMNA